MVVVAKPRPQVSQTVALPVAVGGWDASSPIAEIPPERAVELINLFPKATSVVTRGGWDVWATGMGSSAVETLMPWNGPNSSKLFAAAGAYILDVTAQGLVGGAVQGGLTSARWQFVNFGTAGGNFLWICNGADAPRYTDGTTWTVAALTGITVTDVINVTAHQRRLLLTLKGYLGFGYLAPNSIAGAVTLFNLAPLFRRGGYLMAIASWTRDGGAGPDDYAVFVSSEGEAAVYAGTDPNSPSTWALVGIFNVGQPTGRHCLLKYGTDLLLISRTGVVSLSRVVTAAEAEQENIGVTITARIRDAYAAAASIYGINFGWSLIDHAPTNALYLNVPIDENIKTEQYVMNAITGAWCRYTGINALCWANRSNVLFCGQAGGQVARVFVAETDNTLGIPWSYRGAYIPINSAGRSAHIKMLRPAIQSPIDIVASVIINSDFDATLPTPPRSFDVGGSWCVWDEGYWDQSYWSTEPMVFRKWLETPAYGSCFSLQINGQASAALEFLNFDVLLEPGSIYG